MKSIFIILGVAALASAMSVNRQQQQILPQQAGQGGQQQARQQQDEQIPMPGQQQHQRQDCDNILCLPRQQQGVQDGQQQIGQRQDDQHQVSGQQQLQGGQNRQQQQIGFPPTRQQQQQIGQGGQQKVGQRQDDQHQMSDQQHMQQNRQQQQAVTEENWQLLVNCHDMDCRAERILQGQQQLPGGQNRQQQQIGYPPMRQQNGQGGQQQIGQRQVDQQQISGQQQLPEGQNRQQQQIGYPPMRQQQQQQIRQGGQQKVGQRQTDQQQIIGQQQAQGFQSRQQQQIGQQNQLKSSLRCNDAFCQNTFPQRQQQWIKTRQEPECNELDCPGIDYWHGTQRQDEPMFTYCLEMPLGMDPFCEQLLSYPEPQQYSNEQPGIHTDEIIHADIAEVIFPLVVG